MAFSLDPSVGEAWGRLTSDGSEVNWIACGYDDKGTVLQLRSEGSGGMPEFTASLPDDAVTWGAFKVTGVDDRGNTVSRRPKFIFVKYMPDSVPTMKRARSGGHKGAIKQVMDAHVDFEIESKTELTEEAIIAKLRACGGAHAPNGYEFVAGAIHKVDA